MQNRLQSTSWRARSLRVWIIFLLTTLVVSPAAAPGALASPEGQAPGPLAPAAPGDHLVTNIKFFIDSPNIVGFTQHVNLTFDYITNEPGGVRIFILPFTDGSPTTNYAVSGSPLYPAGSGSGDGFFTISSGQVVVDQVRFRMTNEAQTTILFEVFLPVYYLFADTANIVTNIRLTPDTPDVLKFNQNVDLVFNYATNNPDGVLIFARPFTNGNLTPNYAAHPSDLYPPTAQGRGTGYFTIKSGPVVVDQIRIQMWDPKQTTLIFEAFLPVYYRFWDPTNIVTHVEFTPTDTPNVFKYTDDVNLTFNYTTMEKEGVQIFARPFSGAHLSPSYGAHGSGVYPAGSGTAAGSFHLFSGPMVVDKVRIQMVSAISKTLLFEAFLPVHLLWAGSGPPPGPDMHVDKIEVTQAIQDLNNSVDLVAGKKTFVRVHVSSPSNKADVFATLSGRRGFVNLNPVLNPGNPGSDITVRISPDRGQINDSFWFELPSSWTTAGNLTLTARLDPNGATFDPNTSNNSLSVTVNFKATPPLRLRLVNVQYNIGATTYLETNSHLDSLESWLKRAYPINSLVVSRQTFTYPNSGLPNVDTLNSYLALIKLLRVLFSGEDSRTVYYGVVDDGGGFMRGKAAGIPSTVAAGPSGTDNWGWDFDGSYNDWYGGHEIGHTRGRAHAMYCGAADGTPYPYTGGRISPALTGNTAIYGFDIQTRAIYTPDWKDVMTYCDYQWVSDFTYEGIRTYLAGLGFSPAAITEVTASDFLVIAGLADMVDHTATLTDVYKITQNATVPLPLPGDWTIAMVGASNNDLATYAFAPDELTDAEESPGTPGVIAEVVPWSPGTTRIEIRYGGQVVAMRSASANAPTVNITAPAAGSTIQPGPFTVSWVGSDADINPLTYSLLYSNDGGQTWQALATSLSGSQLELNTNQLPGGNGTGALRVIASDGFLTGQDDNGGLTIPLHAPTVEILLPSEGQSFYPTQQVTLQGSAYDLEDGTPIDSAFSWSSDIDGFLGTGPSLSTTELTTGNHEITLQVTDSDGASSLATRKIQVSEEDAPEILNIQASPFSFGILAPFKSAPVERLVSLRSSSETELGWTASVDVPWLSLDFLDGQTPSDLKLIIDPTGLAIGTYNGKITFSSGQAGNSPLEVFVTLDVTGSYVYLPAIRR